MSKFNITDSLFKGSDMHAKDFYCYKGTLLPFMMPSTGTNE